ncbi:MULTISPECIES: hypothetical protein [Actinosynnema]|uniref:hypothetical protein n=1 Tax=Actinosynnema TaxID=40566 RepID=UPI0020A36608|nr:hypothetical protein [Actinosynnema pretiosum]
MIGVLTPILLTPSAPPLTERAENPEPRARRTRAYWVESVQLSTWRRSGRVVSGVVTNDVRLALTAAQEPAVLVRKPVDIRKPVNTAAVNSSVNHNAPHEATVDMTLARSRFPATA